MSNTDCPSSSLQTSNKVCDAGCSKMMLGLVDDRTSVDSHDGTMKPTALTSSRNLLGSSYHSHKQSQLRLHEAAVNYSQQMRALKTQKEEHRKHLQTRLAPLTSLQVKRKTYSYKHYLFFDLLQDGFVKTHAEIYRLLKYQSEIFEEERRLTNKPVRRKSLEEEEDKICTIARRLMQAESALRIEDYATAYEQHYVLAQYFAETGKADKWLSDHFFFNCVTVAKKNVKYDGGEILSEASLNMGKVYESLGYLEDAVEMYQSCYDMTSENETWLVRDTDLTLHNQSCIDLHRVYSALAVKALIDNDDRDASVNYYVKAYNAAREGAGRKLFGDACLQLALAYHRNDDPDTALLHLHNLMESYCMMKDTEAIPRVLEAMGKAYQSQGKFEESIQAYEEFAAAAEDQHDIEGAVRGCNSAGFLYTLNGHYNESVYWFTEAFSKKFEVTNCASFATATATRVLYGVGLAHQMTRRAMEYIKSESPPALEGQLDWKDSRLDNLVIPVPDTLPEIRRETRRRYQFLHEHWQGESAVESELLVGSDFSVFMPYSQTSANIFPSSTSQVEVDSSNEISADAED